ncbi:MAG: twin-arginine translocase TatA/TatE family subunit [Candidatus Acidiferrum sp.]
MGEFGIMHWVVVLAVVLIFFGGKRIPEVMKGFGEGIRSFKDGMSGTTTPTPPAQTPAEKPTEEKK